MAAGALPMLDEMPDTAAGDRIGELLSGLNAPQREAVVYGEGPLLILAGAGTGKTRVLTHRIAFLERTGQARANEILAITFTNKAAQEMRDRVEQLVGRRTRAMWVMTFHAACARMLRAEAPRLGYTRRFTIYDQADARRLVKRCLDELGVDTKRYTPGAVHHQISDAKNKLRDAEAYKQLVGSYFEQTVADAYALYQREIHRMNAMDFDDLLVNAVNVLQLFQEVRDRYASGFRHVLVDEYQDTNAAQYRWLQLLTSEHRNLAVVGDDAQCLVEGTQITMGDRSTKPIEAVRVGDEVLSSYGSGGFRAARVTDVFSAAPVQGIRVTTRAGRQIESTPDHVHFAGYRVPITPSMYMTSLMRRRDKGCRAGITRTAHGPRSVNGLQLPTGPSAAPAATRSSSLRDSQELLDGVFASADCDLGGLRLVHDERIWPEHHHVGQTFDSARRMVVVTLCATRVDGTSMHSVAVRGRDDEASEQLTKLGMTVKPPRPGAEGWRSWIASRPRWTSRCAMSHGWAGRGQGRSTHCRSSMPPRSDPAWRCSTTRAATTSSRASSG
jgi:hypothetical protein